LHSKHIFLHHLDDHQREYISTNENVSFPDGNNSPQGFLDQIMLKYYHMYDKIKGNHFIKGSVIDLLDFIALLCYNYLDFITQGNDVG